jgi:hypothetical protein
MDRTNNNMAVLGVGISERDEPTTWTEVKPTRKVAPAVVTATEKYEIAQLVYDQKVDYFIDHPEEWDQVALDALGNEADVLYERLQRLKYRVSNGNVHLFPKGYSGNASIEDRHYERVTKASWKRLLRLCSGNAIMPGSWAYYVPRSIPFRGE